LAVCSADTQIIECKADEQCTELPLLADAKNEKPTRTAYVHTVPKLPVLTAMNRSEYPEWHAYFERVYHESVGLTPIDLNKFTWFYHFAPFDQPIMPRTMIPTMLLKKRAWTYDSACLDLLQGGHLWLGDTALEYAGQTFEMPQSISDMLVLKPNDPFIGLNVHSTRINRALIARATVYGFFVRRPLEVDYSELENALVESKDPRGRLEVMHVTDIWTRGDCAWYWHAKGSGVFVECDGLEYTDKQTLVLHSRNELPELYGEANSKRMLDTIDNKQLLPYVEDRQLVVTAFVSAHGIPEVLLTSPLVNGKNVRTLPPHLVTTGYTKAISCDCCLDYPIINCAPQDKKRCPVWYTPVEHELVELIREGPKLGSGNVQSKWQEFARRHGKQAIQSTLNRWLPVHGKTPARRQFEQQHMRATPFMLAALIADPDTIRECARYGGSLLELCPLEVQAHSDDKTMDAALWLAMVLYQEQRINSGDGQEGELHRLRRNINALATSVDLPAAHRDRFRQCACSIGLEVTDVAPVSRL
jgi:hypothetical protein